MIATGYYTPMHDIGALKRTFDKTYECEQVAYDGDWDLYEKMVSNLSNKELDKLISSLES
ncbi:MAG: hypothetical protein AAFX51_16515 [Cyanobacteria bacterium J06636_28]